MIVKLNFSNATKIIALTNKKPKYDNLKYLVKYFLEYEEILVHNDHRLKFEQLLYHENFRGTIHITSITNKYCSIFKLVKNEDC